MTRVLAVLMALVFCVPASQAASYNYYSAIAYSPGTGAAGSSLGRITYENARDWAISRCAKYADDCIVAVYFVNVCGALARGQNGGYSSSKSVKLADAQRNAVRSCGTIDSGCKLVISGCSKS